MSSRQKECFLSLLVLERFELVGLLSGVNGLTLTDGVLSSLNLLNLGKLFGRSPEPLITSHSSSVVSVPSALILYVLGNVGVD